MRLASTLGLFALGSALAGRALAREPCAGPAMAMGPRILAPTDRAPANTLIWLLGFEHEAAPRLIGPAGPAALVEAPPITLASGALVRRLRPVSLLPPGEYSIRRVVIGDTIEMGRFMVDAESDGEAPGPAEIAEAHLSLDEGCGPSLELVLANVPQEHALFEVHIALFPGGQDGERPAWIQQSSPLSGSVEHADAVYVKVRAVDLAGNVGPFGEEWRVIGERDVAGCGCREASATGWAVLAALAFLARRRRA